MAILSDYEEENNDQKLSNTSTTVETPKVETPKKEAEPKKNEKNVVAPNKGNGMDMENYSWTQSLPEVTITVPIPQGTKARSVNCEIKKRSLKVGLKGQQFIIDGEFFAAVNPDDSEPWTIEDGKLFSITLTKQNKDWWKSLFKGGLEIDTEKVEPETSQLSDLDPETRSAVEKMMFDQRQKQMGKQTSQELQNEELKKKFMGQFPNMDFSGASFPGQGQFN